MDGFLVFIITIFLIIVSISWILPRIIAWHFKHKYKVSLHIGRIGLPYLKLYDINLSKNGCSIVYFIKTLAFSLVNCRILQQIDEIGIKSSFLNSDLTKLITLVVRDVRINKDLQSNSNLDEINDEDNEELDFRDKKVPHFINTFAQFMAVHVYNVSAMLLRSDAPNCLIHATASELHLDGSILKNAKSLLVTANLMEARAKVLRHPETKANETCLAEFSFGISMETVLVAQGPLSLDKLDFKMSHTNAIINDGFYKLVAAKPVQCNKKSKNEDVDVLQKILPIIPKKCFLQIDETSLKGVKECGKIEYIASLKTFNLNYGLSSEEIYENSVPFNFYLNDLQLQNSREKLLHLKTINIHAKLKNNVINIFLQLNTLLLIYNHDIIHRWICVNFLNNHKSMDIQQLPKKRRDSILNVTNNTFLTKILKKFVINFSAELIQILSIIKLGELNSTFGFNHIRLLLDQSPTIEYDKDRKYLLNGRHWQLEFLIESFWWSFNEWNHDNTENITKMMHSWGTPIYLGMGFTKICTMEQNGKNFVKIVMLFDTLQLEWSLELADYILLAIKCIKQYKVSSVREMQENNFNLDKSRILLNFAVKHFNCFLQSQNTEYFVMRLNTITVEKDEENTNTKCEEFKLFTLNNTGDYYTCIRTEDIDNFKVFINTIQVDKIDKNPINLTISLLHTITMYWSTNFHLKIVLLVREIQDFWSNVQTELNLSLKSKKSLNTKEMIKNFNIIGKFEFHIEISKQYKAQIMLEHLNLSKNCNNFELVNNFVVISIDSNEIFTINGIKLQRIHDDQLIRAERADTEQFLLPWNQTLSLTIDLFKVVFPYEHNWAESIQSQFFSIVKWLKIVHKIKKKPFTSDSPLPKDLLINIKEYLFEMSDDPFEVKLRDNYELLVDEYHESLKRQKMLKEKVAELCKTHLHLPAGKVEELYANLKKKNADIYIQRSKMILKSSPARTRLFAWQMTDVQILVLADPSIHGSENVVKIMREIDFDSPWPEEPLEFSTLWCRVVSLRCAEWKFQLRDFPQPLLDIRQCYICGTLVGAEQISPKRAIRSVIVDLGEPFEPFVVERGMLPLKFYHDFNCEIESFSYAFGPCWEPVIAQCNLSFSKISAPSRDPSPPLTFWDKCRLLVHGRLTMVVQQLTVLLHASLDPYNTTEEMAITWERVVMDWTNAKFVYKGDLNIYVRTASKYDDVQLLKIPNLKLILNMEWVCLGNPNDHHNVIYCAPDKIPEYSSNQVHDSFRAFRSQNVNLSIQMETKPTNNSTNNCPILLLYGSTLRWIESLKLILSGVTRPTKRGRIFNNIRPRKIQLSRHYKKIHLLVGLHKFQVCYWMSFAMQRGCELIGGRLSSCSEHNLALHAIDDGLKHRPKAEWSIVYMNSDLDDSEIWLKSALHDENDLNETLTLRQTVEKCYCLSVAKVSYGRETVLKQTERNKDAPTHRLVVYDLRGAWTKSNRNVAFALFDTFMKNKRMKKNLSTEALKSFRKDTNNTPLKRRNTDACNTPPNSMQTLQTPSTVQDTVSPMSKIQSGLAANMLQQLIAEADNNAVVYSDDLSAAGRQQHLQGLHACQQDDVQHKNWQISLVNAQVLLKGCETNGYVILSAAKAEIIQRIHRPAWKDRTLVSKTTWSGILECMQYYATVNAGENDFLNENIMWLTIDNIQEKETEMPEISELPNMVPNMVGSGVSVGAVVSDTVGLTTSRQLQRIVSRCKCEFFYVGYGDISVDPELVAEMPPPPQEDVELPWEHQEHTTDAFTLMHHDLNVCTNSLQYGMLLDIVNNLLLYVEPHRKEALERLARMRFQLQLHSVEDQRRPIQDQQTLLRTTLSKLRRLEKDTYLINKALEENQDDLELRNESFRLEKLMNECKTQLNSQSEELDMMLSCFKESQLLANSRLSTMHNKDKPVSILRANEICFKHAQWRLTEADGQIGIADLVLSNFLYTKNSKSDDSVEHLLELGYLRMTNLLPNEIYKEVICPTEIQFDMPIEHKKVLRIFSRERPPVGGISVKEHFEINLVPLTIGLTKKFYNTMMKFCFPERETEQQQQQQIDYSNNSEDVEYEVVNKRRPKLRRNRDSNFYVHIDDVEKMKERAEKNKLFVYIKIPEVPVRVSYKGTKEKNLEDLRDVSLIIPTLEYHNMTWTWLDLLMAVRNDSKKVILSQAIKQKLQIKRNTGSMDESSQPQEEDKARMLFGARHAPENRSLRKGVSGVFKFK